MKSIDLAMGKLGSYKTKKAKSAAMKTSGKLKGAKSGELQGKFSKAESAAQKNLTGAKSAAGGIQGIKTTGGYSGEMSDIDKKKKKMKQYEKMLDKLK